MNAGDAPSSDISGSGMGGLPVTLVRLIRNNPNIFSVVKNTPSPLNTMQKLLARYYGNVNPTLNSEEVEKYAREKAAYGGRMGYAYGSVDEGIMAAPQIANMMGMPVGNPRQNQQGVSELDYRDQGEFVPPIGVKERAMIFLQCYLTMNLYLLQMLLKMQAEEIQMLELKKCIH
jgi:hypothetical protein